MEKVIVLYDWLLFDEILDLDYDVARVLNEYYDDDDDDMDFGLDVLRYSTLLLLMLREALVQQV
jgi:hypothetical protein